MHFVIDYEIKKFFFFEIIALLFVIGIVTKFSVHQNDPISVGKFLNNE